MKAKVARVIGVVVAALLILAAIIALLIFIPQWQAAHIANDATRLEREDNARRTLAQIIGGFVVLAGASIAWWRLRVAQEELKVTREGQVTERFSRAIDHLGNDSLDVRLGAIYALERIARDSRQDHGPIMEILTAYVREHAPVPEDQQPADSTMRPATDIQAVLTVLGRRRISFDPPGQMLDLRDTDLRGANLTDAKLQGANFNDADLRWALLIRTKLQKAYIDADLDQAVLLQTDLRGAKLSSAENLTRDQISGAIRDDATQLPPYVERELPEMRYIRED